MSIRDIIEKRRAELLVELAECDAFLGLAPQYAPSPVPITYAPQPASVQARPRASIETMLDTPAIRLSNGLPAVNPNDTLINDPTTGSVTRLPNGANQ